MANEGFIIVRNYAHVNRSLPNWDTPNGRIVRDKEHYDRLCKENNMVPFERAQEIAEKSRQAKIKPYTITKESEAIIKSAKAGADRKGNVKLGDRAIDALIKKGAIGKKIPEGFKLPADSSKGGLCH